MSSEILSHLAYPAGARHLEKRFGRAAAALRAAHLLPKVS